MAGGFSIATRVRMHVRLCKICNLDDDLRQEINRMLMNGDSDGDVVQFCTEMGIYMNYNNVNSHHRFLAYVNDDKVISEEVERIKATDTPLGNELKSHSERLACKHLEMQEAKADLLSDIWLDTLGRLNRTIKKVEDNPLLPVKDYASAFESVLKSAMLLEGKPTAIFKADLDSNTTLHISDMAKLDALLGGELSEKCEE